MPCDFYFYFYFVVNCDPNSQVACSLSTYLIISFILRSIIVITKKSALNLYIESLSALLTTQMEGCFGGEKKN